MTTSNLPNPPREDHEKAAPAGAAFCLFETPIGSCAIAWRSGRIVRTLLPEADEAQLRGRIGAILPNSTEAAPPPFVVDAIGRIRRLLSGEMVRFEGVPLDLDAAPAFERSVWRAALAIAPGETRTYGEIAAAVGEAGAARAVGRALGRNPFPIIVPCHRVVAAAGGSGGFSAPGGASTKMKMLAIENARRGEEPMLFDRLDWAVRPAPAGPR